MYFLRLRMVSSIYENGRPIKVSYATRSPRGRSDVSMEKTDLSGRLETTQPQAKASNDLTFHHRAAGEQNHGSRHPRSGRPCRSLPALAVVHQRPPPQLGAPLPCWVFEPVFQQVCCALFVVGSSPVYRSFVCHCVSSIEVIPPDVALPYREPSFTAICGSSHLTRAYMCYRPCMFFSCVSCMSFSHFLIGFLSPPSSLRLSPASCPLPRTSSVLSRRIVALVS